MSFSNCEFVLVGQPCENSQCQQCCPHDEFDHDMCIDCGYERDPGEAIDAAMDYADMDR